MKLTSKFCAMSCAALLMSASALAGQFTVESGKTKPLRLTGDAASIVIGNPNVADVAVHNGKLLFVSGKSFGTTNLIIFDKAGRTIYSADIVVTTNTANLVTVNRAGNNFSLDCAPSCKPTVSIGDNNDHFTMTAQQLEQLQDLSE